VRLTKWNPSTESLDHRREVVFDAKHITKPPPLSSATQLRIYTVAASSEQCSPQNIGLALAHTGCHRTLCSHRYIVASQQDETCDYSNCSPFRIPGHQHRLLFGSSHHPTSSPISTLTSLKSSFTTQLARTSDIDLFTMIEYQLVITALVYQGIKNSAVILLLVMFSCIIGLRGWSDRQRRIALLLAIALLYAILAEKA
jgi:hypothetical protein